MPNHLTTYNYGINGAPFQVTLGARVPMVKKCSHITGYDLPTASTRPAMSDPSILYFGFRGPKMRAMNVPLR